MGRHKKQRNGASEYWEYVSLLLPTTRDSHAAMHGTVLHRDDPWWSINYPVNAWGCVCKVRAWTRAMLEKRGLVVANTAPANIASPDWAYDIGAGSRVSRLTKMQLDTAILASLAANPALDKLTDAQLKARFYNTLGVTEGALYIDKIGDPDGGG